MVIPTLNEEKYIEGCLSALQNSRNKDYEIVIVDGHSEDNTVRICERYTDKIIFDEREGIGPARNKGAKSASGKFVGFLDADSVPCAGWIDIVIDSFEKPIVAVGGPTYYGMLMEDIMSWSVFTVSSITKRFGFYYLSGNNSAYLRDFFIQQGGFKPIVCEDVEFSKRISGFWRSIAFRHDMFVRLSTRRFKKEGFLRTLIKWGKANTMIFLGRGIDGKGYRK